MKVCEAAPPRFPQPHLTGVLPGLPRRNHLCSPATDMSTDSQAVLQLHSPNHRYKLFSGID